MITFWKNWTLAYISMKSIFVCVLLAVASGVPGVFGTSRIANGRESVPHSRPWQVAIYDSSWTLVANQYCSGALVHDNWVLTSASCAMNGMYIGLGYHHKYDDHDISTTQFIEGSDYFVHPKFNSWSRANDIALVRLETPAVLNSNVSVIRISSSPPVTGKTLLMAGWGTKSRFGLVSSKVLMEVDLTTIGDTECLQSYGDLVNDVFCTVAGADGGSGCQGDDGGPLVSNYEESDGPLLVGVYSWGSGCGNSKYPDVNVMISNYCGWMSASTANEVTCV